MASPTPKPVKKPPKVIEKKIIDKSITKKKSKKNYTSYSLFLYKILKTVSEDKCGISKRSMDIMNSFVNHFMEIIAVEGGKLAQFGQKNTLTSRDIQSAIKLLIPGELGRHANMEAVKALAMYNNSKRWRHKVTY